MTEPCTLGYHKIRGLGAPCRMLLCFSGEPFYNKAYAGDLKEEWFAKDKPALVARNSYINLPYVIDGDTVVTQSNSVLLYLGRKLAIDKDADFFANHQALDQCMDLRNDLMKARTSGPTDSALAHCLCADARSAGASDRVPILGRVQGQGRLPCGAREAPQGSARRPSAAPPPPLATPPCATAPARPPSPLFQARRATLASSNRACAAPSSAAPRRRALTSTSSRWPASLEYLSAIAAATPSCSVDQHLAMVDQTDGVDFDFAAFPKLAALHAAMKALPELATYFKSPMYTSWAFNNAMFTHFLGAGYGDGPYGTTSNELFDPKA